MSSSSSVGVANTPRNAHSRTQSISSDRPSTIGLGTMSPPLSVSPEAIFIAASAASQIVTNDHDSHSEAWYDQMGIAPAEETALVSPAALQLANNFVDQLLFSIIAVAKSTALSALRPAVSEVLKPKLAKDATNQADEELREYLGGGEVEDMAHSANTESPGDWDLELVWKRTRLRCMVYSSLGDMEEEDEDYYMEQEHLRGESDDLLSDIVSPAVAIFLTSILEFMGEQVLVVAGQAAFNRMRVKYERDVKEGSRSPGEPLGRVVVEELDMERVALDRTFGRLWRSWKKKIRSPVEPNYSRPFSRSSMSASGLPNTRRGSAATDNGQLHLAPRDVEPELELQETKDFGEEASQKLSLRATDPADLPLPDSDVEATYSDEEETEDEEDHRPRPKSLVIFNRHTAPESASSALIKSIPIRRARSLPGRKRPRYPSPQASRREIGTAEAEAKPGKNEPILDTSTLEVAPDVMPEVEDRDTSASAGEDPLNEAEDSSPLASIPQPKASADSLVPRIQTDFTAVRPAETASDNVRAEPDEDEIDDFTEEPEILTSSRISMGGRSTSSTSESGKPPAVVHARSSSVRSVRVIEVQSPRSPTVTSWISSLDTHDSGYVAHRNATPPIAEEDDSDEPPPSANKRNAMVLPASLDDSQGTAVTITQPVRNPSPLKSVHPQAASKPPVSTKVSILGGHEFEGLREGKAVVPYKSSRSPPLPTLPERSTSRPVYGSSGSNGSSIDKPPGAARSSPESPQLPRPAPGESPPSTSAKFKAVRTSEDSGPHRPSDMARNFEELIHSNETLQYTLTPENMRDIDSASSQHTGSPRPSHKSLRNEDAKFVERSRSSSIKSIKRSVSITKQTSLGSHPPGDLPLGVKLPGSVSNSSLGVLPKGRSGSAPQARDARIPRESLQDFADFIRSTGPPGEAGPHYHRNVGAKTTARNPNGPTHVAKSASVDSRRTETSMRTRLQARDASVNPSGENSDLIDFIRRGPPNGNDNNPRIPRHVAPFRTTMDSDQMQMTGAVGGRAIDAIIPNIRNSEASTNITETSAPSSTNSQSALLSQANRAQQQPPANNFDDDDMMPKRTRRRVRDPYAIEFSDEEDDLELTPKPKPKQEESLIDFLNNYPPPPEPIPQPVSIPKKKSSAPNLIARLRSSGNSSGKPVSGPSSKGLTATETRSLSSRAGGGRGYTPIVIPTGAEKFGAGSRPPQSTHTASPIGRVPMKRFEPREAVSSNSRTSDLATFLRDSEPPPSAIASLPSPTETKNGNGFSRMFERRKKSTAY
ncbi:hypothetical protein GGS23DRAFT_388033 [Durotheca rogersii]|uniref:uncharacterized protein n=1 Tax=Durotheca rogersii TaxID=419775 RepID=UPI00221E4968|nr:uncharacterized protein GGS23DRAFT_388033 [Durotheca rogersii]KAI5857334.1 hypothetical protein GGS23DRAFT_388033 [Durotheca rogersii]